MTLELAHHKRIRFGVKSEALSAEQRELFQESWASDLSTIEAELPPSSEKSEPKPRSRAGRQPLQDRLPRIEHRHEPESRLTKKAYLWGYRSNDHDEGPPIVVFD